jgi:hypothetical protein
MLKTSALQAKRDNLILHQEVSSLKTIVNEANDRCARMEKLFTQSPSPSSGRKRPRKFWVHEHIDICIYMNTYTDKYMYLQMLIYINVYIYLEIYTCICIYINTNIHKCIHMI